MTGLCKLEEVTVNQKGMGAELEEITRFYEEQKNERLLWTGGSKQSCGWNYEKRYKINIGNKVKVENLKDRVEEQVQDTGRMVEKK